MYEIFADDTLIYSSTLDDYKISKGSISLEVNKSGSFSFSIYPDHFYYDNFVRLKTVITVYKSGKIVFRGRILNDVTDYWNNKTITCEGELGFLQDSIIRPFSFTGTPEELFKKLIGWHNAQVDDFKKFKIGTVTVVNSDNISRSNSEYETSLSNLNSRLIDDSLGGYFYITHGDDGTDPIPTIHYLADFTKVSTQKIEFGSNLKNYTKTVKANDIATAIIPLGAEIDNGDDETENQKLTITTENGGNDYVYHDTGVELYGWIFKVVTWDKETNAANLKRKAEEYLDEIIKHNITIELNAIDLNLLDKSIDSFKLCEYIHVVSKPHNLDMTLLCSKQTLDLTKPQNDSIVLGRTYSTFVEKANKTSSNIESQVSPQVKKLKTDIANTSAKVKYHTEQIETQSTQIVKHTEKIDEHTEEIAVHTEELESHTEELGVHEEKIGEHTEQIAEQGGQIAEQGGQIAEQGGQIAEQGEQITDLDTKLSDITSKFEILERDFKVTQNLTQTTANSMQQLKTAPSLEVWQAIKD
jgi:archaellum component FlaC